MLFVQPEYKWLVISNLLAAFILSDQFGFLYAFLQSDPNTLSDRRKVNTRLLVVTFLLFILSIVGLNKVQILFDVAYCKLKDTRNKDTVQEMLEGFLDSDEYKAMGKSAEDTILDFYRGLLGRAAEAEGYNYWVNKYRNGMSLSEIGTHGFLDSDEFLSRDQWMRMLDLQPAASALYAQYEKHGLTPVNLNEELLKRGLQPMDPSTFLNAGLTPQMNVPNYYNQLQNIINNQNRSFGDTNIKNEITFSIEHVTDYNDLVNMIHTYELENNCKLDLSKLCLNARMVAFMDKNGNWVYEIVVVISGDAIFDDIWIEDSYTIGLDDPLYEPFKAYFMEQLEKSLFNR